MTTVANFNQRKKGFTLTEIAIVLGIIGLILGAIWIAASAVYSNLRVSKTTTQLLQISQAVRAMYSTSPSVDPAANMSVGGGSAGSAPQTYAQAGVFPSDMVIDVTTPTIHDVWGQSAGIIAATTNSADDSFTVVFTNVPAQACINLLTANTGTGRDVNMTGAAAATPGGASAAPLLTLPILSGAAQAACNNRPASDIKFTFLK